MVNIFIIHEENNFLGFENLLAQSVNLTNHRNQELIQTLIHQTFNVFQFFITFFLDVVFHFVRDQPVWNLVSYWLQHGNVIRCEILDFLFVGHFKASDSIIAEFDWHNQGIPCHSMQLLIKILIFTHLLNRLWSLTILDINWLAKVEHLAQYIWLLSIKLYRFSQPTSYDLAVQLIFDAIVQEDAAPFDFQEVGDQLNESWQIVLYVVVEGDVLGYEEES